MKTYLVTGGAGFIGSHLVKSLLEKGHKVRVLDDFSNSDRSQVPAGVELFEGSLTDFEVVQKAVAGTDGIFHLGAEVSVPKSLKNPAGTLEVNARGTLLLLEAMKSHNVKRLVYSSTSAVYGDQGDAVHAEDLSPRPMSPYAYSKLTGEYFIKSYSHLYDFNTVIFRYFNVYGSGQSPDSPYAAVIPILLDKIKNNQPFTIFGDGLQCRDFVSVSDVVRANQLAIESDMKGEILNIGSGQSVTLLELIQILEKISGKKVEVTHKDAREGDIKLSTANVEKAKKLLGFEAATNLEAGLKSISGF